MEIKPHLDGLNQDEKEKFNTWSNYYSKSIKSVHFNFKEFIFETIGEKSPVEFERMDVDEFKAKLEKLDPSNLNEANDEFRKIIIGFIDNLDHSAKHKYYKYIKRKLKNLISDMRSDNDNGNKKLDELEKNIDKCCHNNQCTPDICNNNNTCISKEASRYFSLFCNAGLESLYKYIYYIPSVLYDGSSFGGFSFFCKNKWPRNITKSAQDWATRFGVTFSELERLMHVKKHALKSAIGAIMSRNFSHNIGSHVIANVTSQINTLNIQDNAIFYKYIQQRNDFLAQITTDFPQWSYPALFAKEIMRWFYFQKHILNFICRAERLQAFTFGKDKNGKDNDKETQDKKKLYFITKQIIKHNVKDNKKQTVIDTILCDFYTDNNNQKCDKCKNQTDKKCNLSHDIALAIPGGTIGYHAFYIIIENFIRNTAKHSFATMPDYLKDKKNLIVTIELIEDDDYPWDITIKIYDNCSFITGLANKKFLDSNDKIDYNAKISFTANCQSYNKDEVLILEEKDIDDEVLKIEKAKVFVTINSNKIDNDHRECILHEKNNFRLIEDFKCDRFLSEQAYNNTQDINNFFLNTENKKHFISFLNAHWTPLHCKINSSIKDSIIKADGSLNKKDWGIAEMKVAACYLAQEDITKLGIEGEQNLNILKAIPVKDHKGFYRLGYEFKVNKPKELYICGIEGIQNKSNIDKNKLNNMSIKVVESYNSSEIIDFEFMLIYDDTNTFINTVKSDDAIIENLPYRLFVVTVSNNDNLSPFLKKRLVCLKHDDITNYMCTNVNSGVFLLDFLLAEGDAGINNGAKLKLFLYGKWIDHLKGWRDIACDDKLSLYLKLTEDNGSASLSPEANDILNNIVNSIKDETKRHVAKHMKTELGQAIKSVLGLGDKNYFPNTLPPIFTLNKEINDDIKSLCSKIEIQESKNTTEDNSLWIYYIRHETKMNALYSENMTGASAHLPIFTNLSAEKFFKQKLIFQMVENALICIAVADERFVEADFLTDDKANFINIKVKFVKTVLQHKLKFTGEAIELTNDLTYINGIDVLIIHQGILDKIFNSQDERNAYIGKLKERIPFIVITTGRGKPDIPKGTKFLPFAIVEDCLLSKPPSKFLLTQNLMNLKGYL